MKLRKIRLNDVLFLFGKYRVIDLAGQTIIYNVKVEGGFVRMKTTKIFAPDGNCIATMKNPILGTPVYRQRISGPKGEVIGEVEPRLTFDKLLSNRSESFRPYKNGKFFKGAHFADITFKGSKYLAESYWPGYRQISVTRDNLIVMSLDRKFIISQWFDYLVLNRFMIEKCQYDIILHDNFSLTDQEYVLLAVMVRQFFRHKYASKR